MCESSRKFLTTGHGDIGKFAETDFSVTLVTVLCLSGFFPTCNDGPVASDNKRMTLREAEIDELMRSGDARAYGNVLRLVTPILRRSAQQAFLRHSSSTEDVEDRTRDTLLACT